ncbi:hypothetical protein EXN22_15465 [Pseudomonas tructae]|uniref:Uncharacterized protein n=1 Tax=Pseudomonas tructae TaxID=2518644 RepID=A0A411MJQ7_9PSED|nr:hypothetical protein [Pseudomonas tructae]QBF27020.1 hypothetical protein EXN22_15465 [Pseudomonas tructae]
MTTLALEELLAPNLPQQLGDGLYMETFPGDVAVLTLPWTGIAEGQTCWLSCAGIDEQGTPVEWTVHEAVVVTALHLEYGLRLYISREELEALGNDTDLTLALKVSFEGSEDEDDAVPFPLAHVTLHQAVEQAPEAHVPKPLSLTQLRIPNLAQPVADGDGGLNIAAMEVSDYGIMAIVEPYLGMAGGDIVEIFWEDAELPIYVYPLDPQDVGKNQFFYLPRARVEENVGWIEAFFRITALSSDPQDSMPLRVLVKLDRPGGIDPDPSTPGHQRLEALILPDEVIEFGVDEALAATGFDAQVPPYEGMVVGDTLRVSWGGVLIRRRVEEADLLDAVTVFIDPDTIARAGDSENLPVMYKIVDEVHNHSDGWSPHHSIRVDTQGYPLAAPLVLDADEAGYIDLQALGYDDVQVQVPDDEALVPGSRLTLYWIGRTPDGQLVEDEQTVEIADQGVGPLLLIANNKVQAIASGLAIVSYQLEPDGEVLRSRRRTVGVVGEPFGLVAPVIHEVDEEGQLIVGLRYVVVEVQPWVGMVNGSWFQLVWRGTTVDGKAYLFEDTFYITGSQVGRLLKRVVRSDHIDLLDGGEVEVSYRIKTELDPQSPIKESEKLKLYVGLSPEILPAVEVEDIYEDEDGAWLDPDELFGYAIIKLPGKDAAGDDVFEQGDEIIFSWIGETAEGTWVDDFIVPPGAEGEDLRFEVWEDSILPSNHSVVRIGYRVIREGVRTRHSKPYELWISNGLRWNHFEINGWNTFRFVPVTGFDGAVFTRRVRYARGVTYASDRDEVSVDGGGKVTFNEAWQGVVTITAIADNGKSGQYSLQSPTKWFEQPSARITYLPALAYCRENGLVMPSQREASAGYFVRRLGSLYGEWGNLLTQEAWQQLYSNTIFQYSGEQPQWRAGIRVDTGNIWSSYGDYWSSVSGYRNLSRDVIKAPVPQPPAYQLGGRHCPNIESATLQFPHTIAPVAGGDYGLNLATQDAALYGIPVAIGPCQDLEPGHRVDIFWGDLPEPVLSHTLGNHQRHQRLDFYLPGTLLANSGDSVRAYFRVVPPAGRVRYSQVLELRLQLQRPGLPRLAALERLPKVIDPALAANGFTLDVPAHGSRKAGDWIELHWGSELLRRQIEHDQAPGPVSLFIDPRTLQRAGDSPALGVFYTVVDALGNYAQGLSPLQRVKVDSGREALKSAQVLAADAQGRVDLQALGEQPLQVEIAAAAGFAQGDQLVLHFTGRTEGGLSLSHSQSLTLQAGWQRLEFLLPNALIRACAGGLARLVYHWQGQQGPAQRGQSTSISFSGSLGALQAVQVDPLDDEGNLLVGKPLTQVMIPVWAGLQKGQWLDLYWQGLAVDGTAHWYTESILIERTPGAQPLRLNVPLKHVQPLDGGEVRIAYRVRNSADVRAPQLFSEVLHLAVGRKVLRLPEVEVEGLLPNGSLDPEQVFLYLPVNIPIRNDHGQPMIQPGDKVHFFWWGASWQQNWADWLEVPAGDELAVRFEVPEQSVRDAQGSTVRLEYWVERSGRRPLYSRGLLVQVLSKRSDGKPID